MAKLKGWHIYAKRILFRVTRWYCFAFQMSSTIWIIQPIIHVLKSYSKLALRWMIQKYIERLFYVLSDYMVKYVGAKNK